MVFVLDYGGLIYMHKNQPDVRNWTLSIMLHCNRQTFPHSASDLVRVSGLVIMYQGRGMAIFIMKALLGELPAYIQQLQHPIHKSDSSFRLPSNPNKLQNCVEALPLPLPLHL